ncbi:hypothetical protein V5799_009882 [Amblyomma americanum]|uniref:Uncharacterized protein n=1 Tax=Amblyomma americanum TaxID=6943 RepID=A0AAQ4F979_AMBAM
MYVMVHAASMEEQRYEAHANAESQSDCPPFRSSTQHPLNRLCPPEDLTSNFHMPPPPLPPLTSSPH